MSSPGLANESPPPAPGRHAHVSPVVAGFAVASLLLTTAACRSMAVVPPAEENPTARATLSGTVRGPDGIAPVAGRRVEAVEVDTGERHETETSVVGAYTFLLPPGRYRLEVALEPGEALVKEPGPLTVDAGELAKDLDFTLGGAGVIQED